MPSNGPGSDLEQQEDTFFFTHVTSFMYEMFLVQAKLESYYNKCYNWIRLTFLSGARNALITRGKKWISNEYFFDG